MKVFGHREFLQNTVAVPHLQHGAAALCASPHNKDTLACMPALDVNVDAEHGTPRVRHDLGAAALAEAVAQSLQVLEAVAAEGSKSFRV